MDFPFIDPFEPVLAPGYATFAERIFHRETLWQTPDEPVTVLSLRGAMKRSLRRLQVTRISQLVGYPLSALRGVYRYAEEEILLLEETLEAYFGRKRREAPGHPGASESGVILACSDRYIVGVLEKAQFASLSSEEIIKDLPPLMDPASVQESLARLLEQGRVSLKTGRYALRYPTFVDFMDQPDAVNVGRWRPNEKMRRVLRERVTGATLRQISAALGLSSERIRQIEMKGRRCIAHCGRLFEEDRFRPLYCGYSLDEAFYRESFGQLPHLWRYLCMRYSRGAGDPEEAPGDQALPVEHRQAVQRWINRGCLPYEGRRVPLTRGAIEDLVLEKHCRDERTLEEYYGLYADFLKAHGLEGREDLALNAGIMRSRANRLATSLKTLWKQNHRLRYYDIGARDYDELLEALHLGQYRDIELSTRKFLRDHPGLMSSYDIRDEYELHNLLKKIGAEAENPAMAFGRMPGIHFGRFDRGAAAREIMLALAPVTADELAERISLEYGHRADSVKASWLTGLSPYVHQGIYSANQTPMPDSHARLMSEALTKDFYYLDEVRSLYRSLAPDADPALVSAFNLRRMGFRVAETYIYRNHPSAEAYFRHLLTGGGIVYAKPIQRRYSRLSVYHSTLKDMRDAYDIVEFEPQWYVSIRRLEQAGVTREALRHFCDLVLSRVTGEEFFTVRMLRQQGMKTDLDSFGFSDWFYSSLLKTDARFAAQRFAGGIILRAGSAFTARDFLAGLIRGFGSVGADRLVSTLQRDYGLRADRHTVIQKAKGPDIFYDSSMNRLYADHSAYPGEPAPPDPDSRA